MSTRLQIKGWDIRFIPSVCVYEEGITSLIPLLRQRRRWVEGSIRRYLEHFSEVLVSEKMSLRAGFDMLVYISEFILPVAIASEFAIQCLFYVKGQENNILLSLVIAASVIIFAGITMWYSIFKYNKQKNMVNKIHKFNYKPNHKIDVIPEFYKKKLQHIHKNK